MRHVHVDDEGATVPGRRRRHERQHDERVIPARIEMDDVALGSPGGVVDPGHRAAVEKRRGHRIERRRGSSPLERDSRQLDEHLLAEVVAQPLVDADRDRPDRERRQPLCPACRHEIGQRVRLMHERRQQEAAARHLRHESIAPDVPRRQLDVQVHGGEPEDEAGEATEQRRANVDGRPHGDPERVKAGTTHVSSS